MKLYEAGPGTQGLLDLCYELSLSNNGPIYHPIWDINDATQYNSIN